MRLSGNAAVAQNEEDPAVTIDKASPSDRSDNDYAWLRDGNVPASRDDRIAEALALVALLFSLGIGLVIALLPVSAKAAEAAAASLEPGASRLVPATLQERQPRAATDKSAATIAASITVR